MPIGPAYTKPPRNTQRESVDKTFGDMVNQAHQLKGSVFSEPKDKFLRTVTHDPREARSTDFSGGGAGILVPKAGMGKAFTAVELEAQRLWGKYWPKMLEAIKNDKRPRGEYVLDLINRKGEKGATEAYFNRETKEYLNQPIRISLNPKTFGMETGLHEASHAFNYRRNPIWGGGNPTRKHGGFEVLDPEIQNAYKAVTQGGDHQHSALTYQADEAAKRMGLVPNSGASLR